MPYHTEFPDFGPLPIAIPDGFTDTSWHNDACPSFSLRTDAGTLILWIEVSEPEQREAAGGRYQVTLLDADNVPLQQWFGTEDAARALEVIEHARACMFPDGSTTGRERLGTTAKLLETLHQFATDADPLPMHADVAHESKRSDATPPTRDELIAALRALAEYAGGSDSGADHPCGRAWRLLDRIDAQGESK